jgi:hypothetical protein
MVNVQGVGLGMRSAPLLPPAEDPAVPLAIKTRVNKPPGEGFHLQLAVGLYLVYQIAGSGEQQPGSSPNLLSAL